MRDVTGRHERLSQLFLTAADLDEGPRREFLYEHCAGDPELRSEVERMLACDREPPLLLRTGGIQERLEQQLQHAQGRIGKFHLSKKLGEGGMGVVWLAEQVEPVRRQVAIKLARLDLATRETYARFESERQALALLNHPNVAQIYDAGVTDTGRPYFVMEYVDGEPITRWCDRHRSTIADRIELFRAVCEGVQHAHRRAIIHRDITPSNVLIATAGDRPVPKIIDFGIAKDLDRRSSDHTFRTVQDCVLGTPAYMSPEQLRGIPEGVDTRTDVYSLGALLYELLTGSPPFGPAIRRGNLAEIASLLNEQAPPKPSQTVWGLTAVTAAEVAAARGTDAPRLARRLAGDLDWIVLRALERDPARRYGSVAELAEDLRRHLANEPVSTGPPGRVYRFRKFARRHWRSVSAIAAVAVVLVGSSVSLGLLARRLAEERDRSDQEAQAAKQMLDFVTGLIQRTGPEGEASMISLVPLAKWGPVEVERQLAGQPLAQARVLDLLSRVYEQWDPPQAVLLSKRAIAKLEAALGPDHPEVLARKYAFAQTRLGFFEVDEAEPVLLEVLRAKERLLGPDHEETLRIVSDLGWLTKRRGRILEGRDMLRRCLERQRQALGDDHPDTFETLWRVAGAETESGDPATARAMLLDALEPMRRRLGENHQTVAIASFNIAESSMMLGDRETALEFLKIALESGFIHGLRHDDGRTVLHYGAVLEDPVFAPVRDDPRFLAMLGPEGYLYDFDAASWGHEPDESVALLERAVRKGFSNAERIASAPGLEFLRERPDFVRLVAGLREQQETAVLTSKGPAGPTGKPPAEARLLE